MRDAPLLPLSGLVAEPRLSAPHWTREVEPEHQRCASCGRVFVPGKHAPEGFRCRPCRERQESAQP